LTLNNHSNTVIVSGSTNT